jgi:transposase
MFIRKNRNKKTGNTSVQVVKKVGRKNKLIKHIGTAKTPLEIGQLVEKAQHFIDSQRIDSGIISFFDTRYTQTQLQKLLTNLSFVTAYETVTYRFLEYFYQKIGFITLMDECFKDLVIIRIVEPCSKRRSKELLKIKFGKHYSLNKIYRTLQKTVDKKYQQSIEQITHHFIIRHISKVISVLFFDVTTLYYEAFDEDDLRKCGFSKDHKHNQPQIVVGLTVTKYGMPLSLKMFKGNKFEGHTMMPCITELSQQFKSKDFVVVADSAMLSRDNLESLETEGMTYIVSARLGNLSRKVFEDMMSLVKKRDGYAIRISLSGKKSKKLGKSGSGKFMVVSYSSKRAAKDRHDREKQIRKAQFMMRNPSATARRYKYLQIDKSRGKYQLNQKLIAKSEQLEGLKGYVTNAYKLKNQDIIQKYSDLWQVENAFRMSKSDLKARPIFHTKKESIQAHLLIVFTSLIISRYIEIISETRINQIVLILNQIKEIVVEDSVSHETAKKLTNLTAEARRLLEFTNLTWVT